MKNIQRAYNICLPAGRPSVVVIRHHRTPLWRVIVIVIYPSIAASAINRRPPASAIQTPPPPKTR